MRISWNLGGNGIMRSFFCEYARSKDPILDLGSDLRETDTQNFFLMENLRDRNFPSTTEGKQFLWHR